jgi:hypothetical protein
VLSIPRATTPRNAPLRGSLVGADRCAIPGFTATSATPILALCRTLLAAGFDPATPMECYRGNTLAVRVHSIGQAARLTVQDNRLGRPVFARWRDRAASDGASPPIGKTAPGGAELGACQ